MIARKQEISLQLNQLIDALLLGRSVLILFCLAAPAALLLKERIYIAHRPMRLGRGETGERIILAGEADKAHKILQGFSASQRLEIHVVHIVELEHLGTDADQPSQRRPGDSDVRPHWSPSLDLLILLRTISAVRAGAGAKETDSPHMNRSHCRVRHTF